MAKDLQIWLRNRAEVRLRNAETYWVATVTPDAKPHSTPVWGVWHDGYFWFTTFTGTRKARNLSANPNVVVHLDGGEDVVIVDGIAEQVDDLSNLRPVSDRYAQKYVDMRSGEPYRPDHDLAGGGLLFRVRPTVGRTWHDAGSGPTSHRWRFDEA
jgi:PPOX class probable F420-dependent enzyme